MNGSVRNNWTSKLVAINAVMYALLYYLGDMAAPDTISMHYPLKTIPKMEYYFGLIPKLVIEKGYVWQVVTCMFVHSKDIFLHIIFNMYILYFLGSIVEEAWGSKKFLIYYFFTGIGSGLTVLLVNTIIQGPVYAIPTVGASGALLGVILAFGLLYPNTKMLLFFVIPIKAKYLALLIACIDISILLITTVIGVSSPISHAGHLGGLLFGLLYFFILRRRQFKFKSQLYRAEMLSKAELEKATQLSDKNDRNQVLLKLYKQIKEHSIESLSDEEFYYIQDMMRLIDDRVPGLCKQEDFNADDPYCLECEHTEACIIREIKQLLEK
ncbi:MAG: rhomboid family intramembrane serine protease [bacterium]|nr:rhomboid family intramembrane serine protease [bacterium]